MKKFKLSVITASVLAITGCNGIIKEVESQHASEVQSQAANEFELVRQNMLSGFVERQTDIAAKQQKSVSELAQEYADSMAANGSWDDIEYADEDPTGWQAGDHLRRLRMIGAAFVQSNNADLADAAIRGLTYWHQQDFKTGWWWADIGQPQFLGEVALMLGDLLPMEQRFQTAMIMSDTPGVRKSDNAETTGGNRSDINLVVIYRGLLINSKSLVGAAVKDMENTVKLTNGEGIQADYSFHQHGAQLYSAGYGEVWFGATLRVAYMVRDTEWRFSQEKADILTNFFLDGWRWMKRGSRLDYNTWGRGISRSKPELTPLAELPPLKPSNNITQMDMVAALTPERAAEAMAFKAHVTGARHGVPSGLNGFKHFWRSDYSTKMADGHFFGIRMNSQRTYPNESGNGENLLGYWLGFGSTFLEQRGDEYHNIFPVWNWKLVPGVTAPEYEGLPDDWGKIEQPEVAFVGGVSNGNYGVTTMDMNLDTSPAKGDAFNTKAKKSWFSFKNEIVALGAGISSTSSENVNTTLNQTLLNGKVTVDGVEVENGVREISFANWVHHDGVGYIFPQNGERHLSNQTQKGNWKRIRSGSSANEVSKDVFTLHISHGVKPSDADYQYIIVPELTAEQTASYQQMMPVTVLQNSTSVQAVRNSDLKITGVVFHQAGSVVISDDLTVSVDKPSVLLVDESGAEPIVTLSTPGLSYAEVKLTLDSKAKGEAVTRMVMTHGKTAEQGNSVTFPFYQGAEKINQAFRDEIKQAEEEARVAAEAQAAVVAKAEAAAKEASEAQAKADAEARAKAKQDLAAGGLELKVTQDAYVRGGNQADKFDGIGWGFMGVENHYNNPALDHISILRFDTNGLMGLKATSAKLKLHIRGVDTRPDKTGGNKDTRLQAFAADAGDWVEKESITWNTLPSTDGATASGITTASHGQSQKWIELDVTDIVNKLDSKRSLDLLLVNIDEKGQGGYVGLSTKEHSGGKYTPQLLIQGELEEPVK